MDSAVFHIDSCPQMSSSCHVLFITQNSILFISSNCQDSLVEENVSYIDFYVHGISSYSLRGSRNSSAVKRTLPFPGDPNFVPSTHVGQLTAACNCSFPRTDAPLGLGGHLHSCVHIPTYRHKRIHIVLNDIKVLKEKH